MNRLLSTILETAYPRACPSCGDLPGLPPADFCGTCLADIEPIHSPKCLRCGMPFPAGFEGDLPHRCANCTGTHLRFDFATAAYLHKGAIRNAVHRLKYRQAGALVGPLSHLFLRALDDPRIAGTGTPWILVPAPIHPRRKVERGYNQAAELAHRVSGLTGLPSHDLLRVRGLRPGKHQMELDRKARLKALSGAIALRFPFRARRILQGRKILFVDDILTTGATASACAAVLTDHGGAEMVAVATLARS